MIEPYQPPSEKELKSFGLICGPLFIVFFGWGFPRLCSKGFFNDFFNTLFCIWLDLGDGDPVIFPFAFGAILIIGALTKPAWLLYIHKPWMIVGGMIGFCISQIILFILFFGLFLPMGLVMKIFGKDAMARKFSRDVSSYRIEKEPQPKDHMETPY
jgi:hypothetical protein